MLGPNVKMGGRGLLENALCKEKTSKFLESAG